MELSCPRCHWPLRLPPPPEGLTEFYRKAWLRLHRAFPGDLAAERLWVALYDEDVERTRPRYDIHKVVERLNRRLEGSGWSVKRTRYKPTFYQLKASTS